MPMAHDQPDNADRIRRLGVGDYLWPSQFRGPQLAAMLDRLLASDDVRRRCKDFAARLDGDDAIGRTCEIVEQAMRNEDQATDLGVDVAKAEQ